MFKVLNDTLSNDTLIVNPDNTMTLIYTGDVVEKPAKDIFKFLETGIVPLTDTVISYPLDAPNGVIIKEALLKSGTFQVIAFNSLPEPVTGYVLIPQMIKDGQPFKANFSLPAANGNFWTSAQIDVSNYALITGSNELLFRYYAYKADGTRIVLPPTSIGLPGIGVTYSALQFYNLVGYWGFSSYPLTRDTIEIDINQTQLDGSVTIKNPKVTLQISNSWGFPTRGEIKYMSFIGQNGEEYPLTSTAFSRDSFDYIDFNYPSITNNELGQTKYTYVTLDSSNSNIAEIFNSQPTRLIYEVEGISNAQLDPDIIGFLTDSSTIKLGIKVELLLEGAAKNFGADQTIDLDFGEYSSLDTASIEAVEFKLVSENGTPISTSLQLFFLDDAGNRIDSLFDGGPKFIIQSPPVKVDGTADGSKRTETLIPMSAARFDRIRRAKKAFLQTAFTTAGDGTVPVKLLANNTTTVKMGIKVKKRFE